MTPETTTPDVLSRVRAGVAWLDANIPDWLGRIDLNGFCIWSACGCILGQLDGNFWDSVNRRDIDHYDRCALGFMASECATNTRLNDAWRSEITRLRAERKTP